MNNAIVTFKDFRGKTKALIYVHNAGDREHEMFREIEQFLIYLPLLGTKQTRFDNPRYLAAKFVVWQAMRNQEESLNPLDFRGVGIISDITEVSYNFEFTVICLPPSVEGTPKVLTVT